MVLSSSIFRKILTAALIASLLLLPLASSTRDVVLTSFDDAIFEVSLVALDGDASPDNLLTTEPEASWPVDLAPSAALVRYGGRPQPAAKPALAGLVLKDIISEIFIPPKIPC